MIPPPRLEIADDSPARILLVDDEQRMLDSLQQLLQLYNFEADVALGGRAAIERLEAVSYDLVLLDLRMPDLSGHAVLAHIAERQLPLLSVVVSGETSVDDVSKALRLGAYDYLKKPYVPDELIATVKNAINKKRLEDANRVMSVRLNRSEKLHRFIVNNSPDIIYILDESGCISFLNSRIEALLGFRREELLGRPVLALVEKEDLEKAAYFFEQPALPSEGGRTIELALKTRDGGRAKRYFEMALWPVTEPDQLSGNNRYRLYGTARDITDRLEAEAFISFQAYHDLLTRLPNRTLFKDRLSMAITQAARNDQHLAVMFIDLDRFKVINDSLGHTMGDRLLQAVGQRLMGCIRKGDTLSRFGGDEFTLLLPDAQHEEAAIMVAEKILESVKQPFKLGGHDIHIGASIGISLYPEGGATLDAMIKNADIAMYRVKNSGKNGYAIFSREMTTPATERLILEQELRRALESDEFQIVYQPQIATDGEQLVGVEALIRWNHPTRGLLSPGDFIPVAEDSRLIIDLDRLTLARACREIGHYHRNGVPALRLAVNLSPLAVEKADFVDCVLATLAAENFPAELLELEITESLLMSDREDVVDKLERLSAAGVQLAIDDFGTGYSSLSYLRKFPVSTLKIDRSFVHSIKAAAREEACIVDAIISMAQGLKLNIIAEGVENRTQFNYLRSLGCEVVQGYLFGQPTSMTRLLKRLKPEPASAT